MSHPNRSPYPLRLQTWNLRPLFCSKVGLFQQCNCWNAIIQHRQPDFTLFHLSSLQRCQRSWRNYGQVSKPRDVQGQLTWRWQRNRMKGIRETKGKLMEHQVLYLWFKSLIKKTNMQNSQEKQHVRHYK